MCSTNVRPRVEFQSPCLLSTVWQSLNVIKSPGIEKSSQVIDIGGHVFEKDDLLRKTATATVYRGVELFNNHQGVLMRSTNFVAIKEVHKCTANRPCCQESIYGEIASLRALANLDPCMSNYVDACETDTHVYLITHLCAGADLCAFVNDSSWECFDECKCRNLFGKLVRNFHTLHQMGWAHRDVSPENILYDPNNNHELVIIDYGMSVRHYFDSTCNLFCKIDNNSEGHRRLGCGKMGYRSPESFLEPLPDLDFRCDDIWAMGVILFVMLTGRNPFESAKVDNGNYIYIAVHRQLATAVSHWKFPLSHDVVDLIQSMLLANPDDRLTTAEILEHPWLQGQGNTSRHETDGA